MKKTYIVTAISATLSLVGCATTKDLSEMESNISTASEGEFGKMHASSVCRRGEACEGAENTQ